MALVRENLVLLRKEGAARIDEVQAGQAIVPRDVLGAQVLFHGEGVIGAAFDRGVVGDDHAFPPRDAPDPGHDPGRVRIAAIEPVRGQRAYFEEGRARIEQQVYPVAHKQLGARLVALPGHGAAALCRRFAFRGQYGKLRPHRARIGLEFGGAAADRALKMSHLLRFIPWLMVMSERTLEPAFDGIKSGL